MDSVDTPLPLLAEVVLDRPLSQAYSYAVPDELAGQVAVGKRVEVPFGRGNTPEVGYVIRVLREQPIREVKSVQKVLDPEALLTESLLKLTRWMADYYVCGWGQVLQAVLPAGVRGNAGLKKVTCVELVPEADRPAQESPFTKKQERIVELLWGEKEPIEIKELARRAQCGPAVIQNLVKAGALRKSIRKEEAKDELPEDEPIPQVAALPLNEDQARVWATVKSGLETLAFKPWLLHGVTGSGKTEIYLNAITETIERGREAIVLVPEISLTPQTIQRFKGRCGNVAVMHSHLTDSERAAYWRRIAAGQVQVVVGARSAVFAPCRKLGLIVIDEEHEGSFKQESTPRYHARDVAVMRAKLENIPILLGSATPALESWHNATKGNYELLSMPIRVMDRPLPEVKIVDMRHEPKGKGKPGAIGPTLQAEIGKALAKGGQVMLFLNRRGFSTHVHCQACGHVAECKHCDVALTFHRQRSTLLCHYCGYEEEPFQSCPACKQPAIRYQGLGTEKLEHELLEKFPSKAVQRMDSDTMQKPGSHQKALDAFRAGDSHILLGTQMIAKGLDFPNVTLVGVINADAGLHIPDFRAAERTFQLLAQVSGRTGRGDKGGEVLIQTYTPDHPSIVLATKHDFIPFADLELKQRKAHRYPPYERLVRLLVRSEKETKAEEYANQLAAGFKRALESPDLKAGRAPFRLLGPAEAPIFKLNDQYRFHFQIQSESSAYLHKVLQYAMASVKPPSGVEVLVDVDPQSML